MSNTFKILIGLVVVAIIAYAVIVFKKAEKKKQENTPAPSTNLEPTVVVKFDPTKFGYNPNDPMLYATNPQPVQPPKEQPIASNETGGIRQLPPSVGALIDLNILPPDTTVSQPPVEPTYNQQPVEPNNYLPSHTGKPTGWRPQDWNYANE